MHDPGKEKGPGGVTSASETPKDRTVQTQVTPDARRAEPLFGASFEFLELHVPGATRETKTGKVVKLGKAPIHKRWTTAPAGSDDEARYWLECGRNVGVRLRDCDLVIDVDPRNGGDIESLETALGVKLRQLYSFVVTGSDGLHVYMAKPADLRISGKLDGFPGIEFKTRGTQVVAPGSVHPDTGRHYEADLLADFRAIAEAPQELLDRLAVQDIIWPAEAGRHEPEELATMLSGLDVQNFADQDRWLELMMACHFGTEGAGREEFVLWSIGDPDYAHDEEVIRHRWDSLRLDHGRPISHKTLYQALVDAGRKDLLPKTEETWISNQAVTDFAEFIEGEVINPEAEETSFPAVRPPHEQGMSTNRVGNAPDTLPNAMAAVHAIGLKPAYDELKQSVVFKGKLPWEESFGRTLDDHTTRRLRGDLIERYQGVAFEPTGINVFEACHTLAYKQRFNPVLDYLNGLEWDGVPRVASLFSRYFRTPDDTYSRAVARCFMVAAVRRQRQPGVKFDTMPVLRGKQGTGKSTGVKVLFGADWFSDADLGDLKGKDAAILLLGKWGQEMAELQGLSRADLKTLKAFCSRATDTIRLPYGRSASDLPRRCVFIGTTNEGGYLTDPTGNRRFWPLEVLAEVDLEALKRDRDQLWAEATVLERAGESIVLDQGLWDLAAERQEEETTEDPWVDLVRRFIDGQRAEAQAWEAGDERTTPVPVPDRIHTLSLFEEAIRIPEDRRSGLAAQRLKAVMTETLKWTYRRKGVRIGDKVAAGYLRWPADKGPMPEGAKSPY